MVPDLFSQCVKYKQHMLVVGVQYGRSDDQDWCKTLRCAIIRGYGMLDDLLRVLSPFTAQLAGDRSPNLNTQLILPIFFEAEKVAVAMVWHLSGIVR